jgi:hypothetical protein
MCQRWDRYLGEVGYERNLLHVLLSAPLLANLFLYSYEAEFVPKLTGLKKKTKKLAVSLNNTYRYYIYDVLSISYHNVHKYVHLIDPDELEIKDITESDKSASFLDILLN